MIKKKPLVFLIVDGLGIKKTDKKNLLNYTLMPNLRRLADDYPVVGLKPVFFWQQESDINRQNTYLTIGAGRHVFLDYNHLINFKIKTGEFFENKLFKQILEYLKKNKKNLHLIGLLSYDKKEANFNHLLALLDFFKKINGVNIFLHLIFDGQEISKKAGINLLTELRSKIKNRQNVSIVSLSGRLFGLDSNFQWSRTNQYFQTIVYGRTEYTYSKPTKLLLEFYEKDVYDNRFPPAVSQEWQNKQIINNQDVILFFNHNPSGLRQLSKLFVFSGWKNNFILPKNLFLSSLVEIDKKLPIDFAFILTRLHNNLTQIIAQHDLQQCYIYPSTREAEIRYFLRGKVEEQFESELYYSFNYFNYLTSEFNFFKVTKKITKKFLELLYRKQSSDVYYLSLPLLTDLIKFQKIEKIKEAVKFLDKEIMKIIEHSLAKNSQVLLSGAYGQAEEFVDIYNSELSLNNSLNSTPLFIISDEYQGYSSKYGDFLTNKIELLPDQGSLTDIAPTILSLLNIKKPVEMTGQSLLF